MELVAVRAPGIAYGNIVGSSISNILLIGGVSALLFPMAIASAALRRDGMVLLAAAIVFSVLAALMPLDRLIGAVLLIALAGYVYRAIRSERGAGAADHAAVYDKSVALQDADAALVLSVQEKRSLLVSILWRRHIVGPRVRDGNRTHHRRLGYVDARACHLGCR